MFSSGSRKAVVGTGATIGQQGSKDRLNQSETLEAPDLRARNGQDDFGTSDEREHFLSNKSNQDKQVKNNNPNKAKPNHQTGFNQNNQEGKKVAKLAKQETTEEESKQSCMRMFLNIVKRKRFCIPIFIIVCIAAVYCIPFVDVQPETPKPLPNIPFNYNDWPLKESSASQLKIDHLFYNQIQGAESLAFDSTGNLYMAVEGGFIFYAHLNKSSPLKRSYYDNSPPKFDPIRQQLVVPPIEAVANTDDLVKIAELNGIKHLYHSSDNNHRNTRRTRDGEQSGTWRRECQLDEKIYGPHLYTAQSASQQLQNDIDVDQRHQKHYGKFKLNFGFSRCSKPLGIRLSPDERYLYVIDTLSGLYRISLQLPERPYATQRLVTKLIDFRNQKYQLLPVIELDSSPETTNQNHNYNYNYNNPPSNGYQKPQPQADSTMRARPYLNVSFVAVDDLTVDYNAGFNGGDLVYMSLASQNWPIMSFVFDLFEGRPSGVIARFDTGSKQLGVLNPNRLAHVRTSTLDLMNVSTKTDEATSNMTTNLDEAYLGIGAPRLDENDVFDERPLYFANGLELTDDRQAILIADTFNRRILKHFIRGPRKGTSDLWAWTPHHPDNIRRGWDKRQETYWVVGCAYDSSKRIDTLEVLYMFPRFRKYLIKNVYMFGWFIELLGKHVFGSTSIRDFGFSLKNGNVLAESVCDRTMILQYNKYGDIIRSIYSKELPDNVKLYSQVNEIIDANNQEHALYLGSPFYKYVTKLVLPTGTLDLPTTPLMANNDIR